MWEDGSTDANSQGQTKASDSDSSVTIEIGDIFDSRFYMADDRPGIAEAERTNVFESDSLTVDDGTGYGLAIVKK